GAWCALRAGRSGGVEGALSKQQQAGGSADLRVAATAVLGRGTDSATALRRGDGPSAAGRAGVAGRRGGGLRVGAVAGGACLALRSSGWRAGDGAGSGAGRVGVGGRRAPL